MINKTNLILFSNHWKFLHTKNVRSMCNYNVTLKKEDFYDHRNIFKFKTTWELYRSVALLKLCSFNWLVDNSMKVLLSQIYSYINKAYSNNIMKLYNRVQISIL